MAAAMTINSIQDLVRVLDEHPEWVEALRVRLLTREVLELPQRLADFVAAANQRFEAIEARLDRVDDDLSTLKAGQARMQEDLSVLKSGQARMQDDLSVLKGGHARNAAERQAVLIAEDLGFEYVRTLTIVDIRDLVRSHDTADIPVNDLRSFRLADLIVEATDAGESCYVAAEISFTANGRDTKRALRNAGFLTRFTGRRAYAVIASVQVDDRIRGVLDDGDVSWYRLDRKTLDVA
ncbi:MAG: hypothetical protein OXQ31_14800 [Spirochaetaceae bacterium]|nr:hypothetical protein [Spirochaetaceae bacterium]